MQYSVRIVLHGYNVYIRYIHYIIVYTLCQGGCKNFFQMLMRHLSNTKEKAPRHLNRRAFVSCQQNDADASFLLCILLFCALIFKAEHCQIVKLLRIPDKSADRFTHIVQQLFRVGIR